MSRRTTARTIPGGIVDTQGERVFVHDRGGRVLALDAAAGRVLWRSENAFLPLLALADKLIGARITGPNSFEVVIVAPADGREICNRIQSANCLYSTISYQCRSLWQRVVYRIKYWKFGQV